MPLLVAGIVTIAVVVGFIIFTLKNLLLVAGPNQVLVLAGRSYRRGGKKAGYRAIRGGRAVRWPLIEKAYWMNLSNIPVDIEVRHAFSKGGIPLNVQGVAHVKMPGEEPRLSNAIERFLGRNRTAISQVARETLEGNVRGVLAQLTPEQVNEDKVAFANQLLKEAEHDFVRMGLVLDTLKIQNVTDDANYLNSIGRIRGAAIRRDAAIAEAQAESEAEIQKAGNWRAGELANIKSSLAVAREETRRRVKDALTGRAAHVAKAEGEVRANIARIQEDIQRQKARVAQVERQLEADVIQPWDAERQKMEEEARADAATIVERGRAEAGALAKMVDEYRRAGPAARDVLILQQLMPMLGAISGADRKLSIKEWTVMSNDGDSGVAQKAIQINEQLKAATGVDFAKVAGRFGASGPPTLRRTKSSVTKAAKPKAPPPKR